MRLCDLLDESLIKLQLESVDKEECMEELIDVLVRAGRVTDRAAAIRAIKEREAQGSTGIGKGVAVPHGRLDAVKALTGAMGISRQGMEFDSVDGQPVHIVFLLLASGNNPGPHLQALHGIARLVSASDFCRRALEAKTPKEMLDILEAEG